MKTSQYKTIKSYDTPFGQYSVCDGEYNDRPARILFSEDNVPQSGLALDDEPEQLFFYTQRLMEIALSVQPGRVLAVGGGAFTVPSALARQLGIDVDAVEINPELEGIAREHFSLSDSVRVINEDGGVFIDTTDNSYDMVILDAFSGRTIPEALISPGNIARYSELIGEGVLAINCISRYHTSSPTLLRELVKKLRDVFRYIAVYPADTTEDSRVSQNLIITASNSEYSLDLMYLQSNDVSGYL